MDWVLIFPVFRAVSEIVGDNLTYWILMNVSFFLVIPCFIVAFNLIRIVNSTRFRRWAAAVAGGSIVICAVVVFYFLFTDFGSMISEMIGNVLVFLTTSAVAFGFYYCICFPVLLGFFLAVLARSLQAIVQHRKPTATQ